MTIVTEQDNAEWFKTASPWGSLYRAEYIGGEYFRLWRHWIECLHPGTASGLYVDLDDKELVCEGTLLEVHNTRLHCESDDFNAWRNLLSAVSDYGARHQEQGES